MVRSATKRCSATIADLYLHLSGETKTADVKLIADQAKKAFILQGLAADIPVAFEEKTNTLTIKPQELAKPQGVTASLILASYAGWFPGADGKATGDLTWGADYTYSATWDAVSIEHPVFPFTPRRLRRKEGITACTSSSSRVEATRDLTRGLRGSTRSLSSR